MKIRLHVNKNEIKKGKSGWPWTIHTSKACIKAREVKIYVPCITEYKPDKKTNPKVFLLCYGRITEFPTGRFVIGPSTMVPAGY